MKCWINGPDSYNNVLYRVTLQWTLPLVYPNHCKKGKKKKELRASFDRNHQVQMSWKTVTNNFIFTILMNSLTLTERNANIYLCFLTYKESHWIYETVSSTICSEMRWQDKEWDIWMWKCFIHLPCFANQLPLSEEKYIQSLGLACDLTYRSLFTWDSSGFERRSNSYHR